MISWLLDKLNNWLESPTHWWGVANPTQEDKLVEGVDYRIEPCYEDDSMVEIIILRGPDAGQHIRIMAVDLEQYNNANRPTDTP